MKLSELIKNTTDCLNKHGDLEVQIAVMDDEGANAWIGKASVIVVSQQIVFDEYEEPQESLVFTLKNYSD